MLDKKINDNSASALSILYSINVLSFSNEVDDH